MTLISQLKGILVILISYQFTYANVDLSKKHNAREPSTMQINDKNQRYSIVTMSLYLGGHVQIWKISY